jgi:hypothetical protein
MPSTKKSSIRVRNQNTTLPIGAWYPEEEEEKISKKMLVVAYILWELCESNEKAKKLKHHSIHEFTRFIWDVASGGMIQVGQLEFLAEEVQSLSEEFKNSKSFYLRERTSSALQVMIEIIDGNYHIDSSIYKDPNID